MQYNVSVIYVSYWSCTWSVYLENRIMHDSIAVHGALHMVGGASQWWYSCCQQGVDACSVLHRNGLRSVHWISLEMETSKR